MIYIKLDDSMNLVITVNEPIYRGDNLNQKIIYLIPLQVGRNRYADCDPLFELHPCRRCS